MLVFCPFYVIMLIISSENFIMSNVHIPSEQYIEHEVKLRVMKEINDERFLGLSEQIKRVEEKIESRFLLLIGLIITSIILPVVLHSLKLV
jgi:hypothetical protein